MGGGENAIGLSGNENRALLWPGAGGLIGKRAYPHWAAAGKATGMMPPSPGRTPNDFGWFERRENKLIHVQPRGKLGFFLENGRQPQG